MGGIDYMEVGRRIKKLRDNNHLTQVGFAKMLNITQAHLSRVERGGTISNALCELLSEKFGVSKNYLLYGTELSGEMRLDDVNADDQQASSISLKQATKIVDTGNSMMRMLNDSECEYYFVTREICRNGEVLYPPMVYHFRIMVEIAEHGYKWIGQEIEHVEVPTGYDLSLLKGIDELREFIQGAERTGKRGKNTVFTKNYRFEMLTEFDSLPDDYLDGFEIWSKEKNCLVEYKEDADVQPKMSRAEKTRLEKAQAYATYRALPVPESAEDELVYAVAPDQNRYCEDGEIDREAEFRRFREMIYRGVAGKTLIPQGKELSEDEVEEKARDAIANSRSQDLNLFGSIRITTDGGLGFQMDDKVLTPEQFVRLLKKHSGCTLEYQLKRPGEE